MKKGLILVVVLLMRTLLSEQADQFDVPILFLIFNRPKIQEEVFNQIKKKKPKQLFVAADGPRTHVETDKERCEQARQVLQAIDWPCEIHTLFRDKNVGCDTAVSQAISWFFEHVEEGIIVEDDCIPSLFFFDFCKLMLERYRDNEAVWNVLGVNYYSPGESYFFTHNFYSTGWATWKRAWKHFDPWALRQFNEKFFRRKFKTQNVADAWIALFKKVLRDMKKGGIWGFDCQWMYQTIMRDKLCIHPPVNTIDISGGCGPDATWFHDPYDLRCFFEANEFDISEMAAPQAIVSLYEYKAPLGVEW